MMISNYKNRVISLENKIINEEFFVERWERVKDGRDLTQLCDEELCDLLNKFWLVLPDSKSIQRQPFYELCDLCEGNIDANIIGIDMLLLSGVRTLEFTKKNGEYRKMTATRNIEEIRKYIPDCEPLTTVLPTDTSIVVFDVEKKEWRRFLVSNFIDIN